MDFPSIHKSVMPAALAGLMTACASGPSIHPQLAESSGSIRAAEEVGAQQLPPASLHLKLAKENLQRGQEFAEKGEQEKARRALERAELDAELAIALVKEHEAQNQLQTTKAELDELSAKQ